MAVKGRFADLHTHTTASDGTLTPSELVKLAAESGLSVLAITDHDTVLGIDEAQRSLPSGLDLVSGVEFSCLYDGNCAFKLHILGLGVDTGNPSLLAAVELARRARLRKHSLRLGYLKERFGIEFTEAEKEYLDTRPNVSKLHIARLLIDRGLCFTISDGIEKFMSAPDFPDGTIPAAVAINAIKEAGGVSAYAHALGGESEGRLSFDEVAQRVKLLKDLGIGALECYYSRYNPTEIDFLLGLASECGLAVSGGSDFHGKNKTVRLGDTSTLGTMTESESLTVLTQISDLA